MIFKTIIMLPQCDDTMFNMVMWWDMIDFKNFMVGFGDVTLIYGIVTFVERKL